MPLTISAVNPKGGTGKTTIAVHLAVASQRSGYLTKLVDVDPRGTALDEGRRRKAEDNGHACGEVPLGYRKNGKGELEPDSKTALIVQRISELRDEGESLRSIADRLNADQVPTKSGGEWHASTVRYVLNNPKYGGRLRHTFDGTAVEAEVERLQIG
jgi:hypothetical protein